MWWLRSKQLLHGREKRLIALSEEKHCLEILRNLISRIYNNNAIFQLYY